MRAVVVALVVAGCAPLPALTASVEQPHPRASVTTGMLPRSETLRVFEPTGMGNVRVRSSAEFVALSRDRVRFHLAVSHHMEQVWLEDELGHRYQPVREAARVERLFHPGWRVPRDPRCPFRCGSYYDIWLEYETADYVFDVRDIMGPGRRSLVLTVVRTGIFRPLRFTWNFGDGPGVWHDDLLAPGVIAIPGRDTMVRSSVADAATFHYLPRPDER